MSNTLSIGADVPCRSYMIVAPAGIMTKDPDPGGELPPHVNGDENLSM